MSDNTIYVGEHDISIDLTLTLGDYTIEGPLSFVIGPDGGPKLDDTGTVGGDFAAGALTVVWSVVPSMPEGAHSWQLFDTGSRLLSTGSIEVKNLIGGTPSVVPEVGVNAYSDMEEADAYFAARLYADAWTQASADDRARALITGTSSIDGMMLAGVPASSTQAMGFPRILPFRPDSGLYYQPIMGASGAAAFFPAAVIESTVPQAVKEACFEEALALLKYGDSERVRLQDEGVTAISIGKLSESYGARRGKLSSAALDLMRPFLLRGAPVR